MANPSCNKTKAHRQGWVWWVVAVISCPCHLPLVIIFASGTTFGIFLHQYWVMLAVPVVILFCIAITKAMAPIEEQIDEQEPKLDGE